jgi:hypothetical protein
VSALDGVRLIAPLYQYRCSNIRQQRHPCRTRASSCSETWVPSCWLSRRSWFYSVCFLVNTVHTLGFLFGVGALVNTLGTTANPYCYGARSWSLSRAPPPAIHGCHQCAAQPKSCIIHCQPCPSRLCCTAVANVQGASMSQGLHGLYGNHRLSLTQRDLESWADRLFTSTS